MKNFIFKSSDPDLQKMFQLIETIQKNVLYLTFRSDKILKIVMEITVDKSLQKQVDEYFDQDISETSPQTDTDDKESD